MDFLKKTIVLSNKKDNYKSLAVLTIYKSNAGIFGALKCYDLGVSSAILGISVDNKQSFKQNVEIHNGKTYNFKLDNSFDLNGKIGCVIVVNEENKIVPLVYGSSESTFDYKSKVIENLNKSINNVYTKTIKPSGVEPEKVLLEEINFEPNPSVEKQFFEEKNIQGFRGGKFAICLIYNNEVVMSYIMGKAFFGKGKYEWEVIRGATKLGCSVIGGASKIWKYFKNNYNPQSCVYYVDYNYFNGQSIQYLDNFKFIKTQPSFKNWWRIENKIKNRDPLHHKEIKELEKEGLVIPIYNAGTKVYVWEKD